MATVSLPLSSPSPALQELPPLVARVQQGSSEAFAQLEEDVKGLLYTICAQFPSTPSDWDDKYQEALLGLYEAALGYTVPSRAKFTTFMGLCVRRKLIDWVRARKTLREKALRESILLEEYHEPPSWGSDPLEVLMGWETHRVLGEVPLSKKQQEVFALMFQGYHSGEIAEILHITPKAADNHMQKIKRKFREELYP